MLNSLWQLLANFGVDTQEIAEKMGSLIKAVVDADGNVVGYEGTLADFVEIPVIGEFIKGVADLAPVISDATDTVA